jgi:hypothetical protein
MPHQNRLSTLQMRVRRHGKIAGPFGALNRRSAPLGDFKPQLINCSPHVKAQIGRDLLIAAAAAVQLVSGFSDQRDEFLLHKVMNVLSFVVVEKRRRRRSLRPDLLQPLQNADQLARGKYVGIFQGARVRAAGRELVLQQPTVKAERPLPALEVRVQRLPEPARPHLHQPTSTRERAREREGSPRMRMNPAASFWSYSAPMVNDERSVR